jgi:hypothetical protein
MLSPRPTKPPPPEATEAATTASTRCMAGTPTYGYPCGKLAQQVPDQCASWLANVAEPADDRVIQPMHPGLRRRISRT